MNSTLRSPLPSPRRIIQNAVWIPTEDIFLQSTSTHDYNCHTLKDGGEVCVDGGHEYIRRSMKRLAVFVDWSLYQDDGFERIAERLLWGTYGKEGKASYRWVPLSRCETDHLEAILTTQLNMNPLHRRVAMYWLGKRERLDEQAVVARVARLMRERSERGKQDKRAA